LYSNFGITSKIRLQHLKSGLITDLLTGRGPRGCKPIASMPSNNLHSLDTLVLSVRDTESKRLTQEAVTAYQAGAYRAAVLSIWVAVCADIISKLRELATGGDAAALADVKNLDTWIQSRDLKKLQQFENGLIERARDMFEMLLSHEATDLLRLRDDRHLCAHPSFVSDEALFSPTAELARAHIAHSILHLLSRPPVQGKQLIARYDRDLLGGSFPKDLGEIEVVLRQNYLARAKPGSVVSIVRGLAKALLGAEAGKYKGREHQITLSLAAIGRIAPGPYEEHLPPLFERLGRELDDGKVLVLCRYIEPERRIWDWLGESGQARILAKIDNAPVDELALAARARHAGVVGERLLTRLKKEDPRWLESAVAKFPCRAFVAEALSLYGASHSFATAEKRGADILLPHTKFFTTEDIEKLNTIIRENEYHQIVQAGQTATILTQVFDQTRQLLPAAAPHWSAIAEWIVERKAASDYNYPRLFAELKKAGVKVPEVPKPKAGPDDDIPF
jgi:hypothetical protein